MGFVAVKCPSCGAEVNLDESREFGFCTYCGTKVLQDKIVIEHRGQVSVDGISTLEIILDRANIYLEQKDFENAKEYYNKALDVQPRCAKAYWGLLLCKKFVSNNSTLIQLYLNNPWIGIEFVNFPEYKNALQFANSDERNEYLSVIQQIESRRPAYKKQSEARMKSEWKTAGIIVGVIFLITFLIIVAVIPK